MIKIGAGLEHRERWVIDVLIQAYEVAIALQIKPQLETRGLLLFGRDHELFSCLYEVRWVLNSGVALELRIDKHNVA